jgi:serine/threonine-protein kinase
LARTADVSPIVKVLDFGIAAGEPSMAPRAGLTKVEYPIGTPAYMSPEQMMTSNEVDARSDVWSMGVLLYQLIAGSLPFPGRNDLELFSAAMTRPPRPLRAVLKEPVPRTVEQVLLKCMSKSPGERYPSMRILSDALRSASLSPA